MSLFNFRKKVEKKVQSEILKDSRGIVGEHIDNVTLSDSYLTRDIYTAGLTHPKMWKCYQQNEWIRACVDAIVNEVVKYEIIVKPKKGVELNDSLQKEIDQVYGLLGNPNKKIESFGTLRRKYLTDILVYDSAALEIVYKSSSLSAISSQLKILRKSSKIVDLVRIPELEKNLKVLKAQIGKNDLPLELYDLDGSLIRIDADKHGNFKKEEKAYLLLNQAGNKGIATFSTRELVYFMARPRAGSLYGVSPIDTLIYSILSDNEANDMNRARLSRDGMISGVLSLPGMNKEKMKKAMTFWKTEARKHGWKMLITNHKDVKFTRVSDSAQEMEFMQYQKWLKSKIMAVYGVTPIILGGIDGTTGKLNSKEQREQFKTNAVLPLLKLEAYRLTDVLIHRGFGFADLEIGYVEPKYVDPEMNLKKAHVVSNSDKVVTVDEYREFLGLQKLDPVEYGDRGKELIASTKIEGKTLEEIDEEAAKSQEKNSLDDVLDQIKEVWEDEEEEEIEKEEK